MYKHPTLGRTAEKIGDGFIIYIEEGRPLGTLYAETELLALGFVKEEQSKREDWISKAYGQYDSDKRTNGPDDYESFREAIEKHLPKQEKKYTLEELIKWANNYEFVDTTASRASFIVYKFLKDHNLLQE